LALICALLGLGHRVPPSRSFLAFEANLNLRLGE
jgi:hypothetical protein